MGTYKDSHFKKRVQINYTGVVVASFFAVIFLLACMPFLGAVNRYIIGIFGIAIYPETLIGVLVGYAIATNRKFSMPRRNLVLLIVSFIVLVTLLHSIFHIAIIHSFGDKVTFKNYGDYIKDVVSLSKGVTVGGVLFGLIVYPFVVLFGNVGTCIIFAISMCVSAGFLVDYYITLKNINKEYKMSRMERSSSRSIPLSEDREKAPDRETIMSSYKLGASSEPIKASEDSYTRFMGYDKYSSVTDSAVQRKSDLMSQENDGDYNTQDSIVKIEDEKPDNSEAMNTLYGSNYRTNVQDGYDKEKYASLKDYIMSPYVPPVFLKNREEEEENKPQDNTKENTESHINLQELSNQNPTDAFERFRAHMDENRDMVGEKHDSFEIDNKEEEPFRETRDLPNINPMAFDDFSVSNQRQEQSFNRNAQPQTRNSDNNSLNNYREVRFDNSRQNNNIQSDFTRRDDSQRLRESAERSRDLYANRDDLNRGQDRPLSRDRSFGREDNTNLRRDSDFGLGSNNLDRNNNALDRRQSDFRSPFDSRPSDNNRNIANARNEEPVRLTPRRDYFAEIKPERDPRFPSLSDFDADDRNNENNQIGRQTFNRPSYDEPQYLDQKPPQRDLAFEAFEADNFNRTKSGRGKDLSPRKTPDRSHLRNDRDSFSQVRENQTFISPFASISQGNNLTGAKPVEEKPSNPFNDRPRDTKYNAPPTSILVNNSTDPSEYGGDYESKIDALESVLQSLKIPAKVINIVKGPTFSKFELAMPQGIPVKKILSYDGDIAMALMSKNGVRIEAPIPGKNAVGIEIPNDKRATVGLREILESKEFKDTKAILPVAIGKNISGETIVASMAKMVHLLVAGSTGSGKSVFLHNLILSLMYKSSPEELRFILIDPKRVEFGMYNGMPHLMLPNVVTDCDKAINAFSWAVKEMDRRYKLFETYQAYGVNDIEKFNKSEAVTSGSEPKLPYIVVIVDELADLMMVGKRDVEGKIQRIAQLGRACGIHLVIATQRPSVEVVTGTIKSNLPTRVAFSLTSFIDSRTILDEGGAEKLLGKGDMLYSPQDASFATRLQSAYTETTDIKKVIQYIKDNNEIYFDEEAEKEIMSNKEEEQKAAEESSKKQENDGPDYDELLPEALKYFIETNSGSTSMIQRRFRVGYARAARILDQMEVAGFVSPANGSKARNVYITMEQYENMFGDGANDPGDDDGDGYDDESDDYDDGGYDE